jgi:hypothetical protein
MPGNRLAGARAGREHAPMRIVLAALLVLVAAAPSGAAPRYDVDGPRAVRVGERVAFTVTGAEPGEQVEVSLAPTINRGGNCCGISVRGARADADGVVQLRFRGPKTYFNGSERVRWTRGAKADVIVYGEGRGIAVVRVRRP